MKEKTINLNTFSPVERIIIKKMYYLVAGNPKDMKWRIFRETLSYQGKKFLVECEYRLNSKYFQLRKPAGQADDGRIILPYGIT